MFSRIINKIAYQQGYGKVGVGVGVGGRGLICLLVPPSLPTSGMITIQLPLRDFLSEDYWPSGLILVAGMSLSNFSSGLWMQHGVPLEKSDSMNSSVKWHRDRNPMWNKMLSLNWWTECLLVSWFTGTRMKDEHLWGQLVWTVLIRTF